MSVGLSLCHCFALYANPHRYTTGSLLCVREEVSSIFLCEVMYGDPCQEKGGT